MSHSEDHSEKEKKDLDSHSKENSVSSSARDQKKIRLNLKRRICIG